MDGVFDQIDDLLTRVESGISLNSYAETLAQMKIDYKKSLEEPDQPQNYLLRDRMKDVLKKMDDYAKLWRIQEVDHFKFASSGDRRCYVQLSQSSSAFDIACMKEIVLSELRPIIDRSKTAHRDGW